MDKALAAKVMEVALSLGKESGTLDSLIGQLDNGAEKEEFVQALGTVMSVLTRDIMFRIIRDHPELDPDR